MKKSATFTTSCLLALFASAGAEEEAPKVEYKPLVVGAFQEFGAVQRGLYQAGTQTSRIVEFDWIDHFGASLTQEVVVQDRLHLAAGFGGVFQFRKPETVGMGFGFHQRKGFFAGPSRAEAVFHFGDTDTPWLQVGAGMFGYKYNPEAYNLGEYLLRSGAYPTYTYTGGYSFVNSAGAQLQGFKTMYRGGNLRADLFLFTETTLAPLYDWSLAGIVGYSLGDGLLDLGAGVNFQRLLKVRPSRTAVRTPKNAYFTYGNETFAGASEFYANPRDFYNLRADTLSKQDSVGNATRISQLRTLAADYDRKANLVDSLNNLPDTAAGRPDYNYYSAAGTLLMARATLDPKKLFGQGIFGKEDLKLYGEVNVLGVKDYPIFYTNITERMPVMVGFNVPAFGLLDLIAVQAEYFNSPWMNNTYQRGRSNANIPYFPQYQDENMSEEEYYDSRTKDNLKWSILLQKKFSQGIGVTAQAASDHLRIPSSEYYYGPQFDHNEVTAFGDHWYWMLQVSWGL